MSASFDLGTKSLVSDVPPVVASDAAAGKERAPLLVTYWLTAVRRRWVILPIIAAFIVLGLVATMLTTPQYTAASRIEISKSQKNVTKIDELNEDDKLTDITFYQTQYALLRARSLAERVARAANLVDDRSFYEAFGLTRGETVLGTEKAGRALAPAERQAEFEKVVGVLLANVDVTPVRDSSLVDVRFTTPNPALSAKISNAWVQQFIQANVDQRFAATADARSFLESRLDQLRRRLEQSERDLVNYSSTQGIVALSSTVDPDGKTRSDRTLVGENLEALNTALAQATAERIQAQSRVGSSPEALTTGVGGEAAGRGLVALRERRAAVAAERSKLLAQFEPGYPPVQALTSQLESLDRDVAAERSRLSSSITERYREAVVRENRLRGLVDELKGELNNQQRRGIQANIYQREVDTNRELYNALLQRYKEIGVAGVGSSNVFVVDPAKVPTAPSSPKLLLNLLIAAFLGFVAAGAATFALEQVDERVQDPSDVTRLTGVPLLGAIPISRDNPPLDHLNDPKSVTSDAYFTAVTGLRFSTDHGIPRSIMVTSTRAGEGKSTSASAIARIIGRIGKRVVLIDCDMRSPSLHALFGVDNDRGVSNYLAGEDSMTGLLKQTGKDDITLMTTGPQPPNAAELLSGERMKTLLATLLDQFDHVVIDMPPVLGLADAPLLAQTVEGVVYVIGAREASGRAIKTALSRLFAARARILGAVFTKLQTQSKGYGYGYEYGYGYGQADERSK